MKLFLDTCALIYRFKGSAPFRTAATQLLTDLTQQQTGVEVAVEVAVSRLSILECRIKPLRDGDKALLARYDAFFANVHILELSANVVDTATHLRARHGLKTPDALQAACALEWDTEVTFVTGDGAFAKLPMLDVRVIQA